MPITKQNILQTLILSFIFIVLPAGSWYYLNEGFNYRKALIDELDQDLGKIPAFELTNQNEQVITKKLLGGKVVIANFLSLTESVKQGRLIKDLVKVQDQFDKRDDIIFLTFTKANTSEQLSTYFQQLQVKRNKNQWHFLRGTDSDMNVLAAKFELPNNFQTGYADNATLIITDTSSTIRYAYDFRDEAAVKKLIEHIAVLMPAVAKRELRADKK